MEWAHTGCPGYPVEAETIRLLSPLINCIISGVYDMTETGLEIVSGIAKASGDPCWLDINNPYVRGINGGSQLCN